MAKKLLKPKRGKVENLSKLAIEDGSLVFAHDTKATTSTVLVDIGDTRYDLAAGAAKKADNADALGGSSLQNIVDKINNSTGNGTAFTGLDTTTNNKVKLTRANGGTVEKIINNVSNASTANYAKIAVAGTANYLYRNPASRSTSANLAVTGLGGLRTFKATSSMTEGKPPVGDAHIIHLDWDNTGGYDAQIAVQNTSGQMAVRGMSNKIWQDWRIVLDSANYTSYAAKKNAYDSASVSNATITLGRSDGSTGTTLTVNNVAHATSADLAKNSNALGGSSLKNITDKINSSVAANDAMHYMGTLGATAQKPTITALPTTARIGDAYKVITAGTYASIAAEVGDLFIYSGSWTLIPSGDDGNVYVGDSKSSKFAAKSNNIVVAVGDQKVASAANVTANAGTISALQSTMTQLKANQGTVTTLNGNKATFSTLAGRLKGDSNATYFVRSTDTRAINTLPSTYMTYKMGSKEEFKESTAIGLTGADTYSHIITHIPWADSSGGRPFQVAYSGTKIFARGSASDSAWSEWYKVITGADALTSSASAISSTNNYFTAGATTAYVAAKTKDAVGNYLPLSGGTLTGKLQVNDVIFGYRYTKKNNAPAFVFDKPGSYYTGIGAHGTDTIYFSAVTSDGNFNWNNDYKQKWIFNGTVTATTVTADYFNGLATNSDKLDGYHENSFLRYRNATSTAGKNTLWDQIGIQEYDNCYPDGLTNGIYGYGEVISLPSSSARFDLWVNHNSSNQISNGLQYRSGWGNDKKSWRMILDSVNYTNYAAAKNSYNNASISDATIKLVRSDGSTGTTLVVNNVANATFASTAEYAKNAGKLGGVEASKYAKKEDIPAIPSNLDVANRLQSYAGAGNTANSLFYRYGVLGSSWSNFPVSSLPSTGIGANFQGKNTGVLHIAAGSSYHDLAFTAGAKDNQGILYAGTGRNPAYILDTENYKTKGNVFNSLTANTSFTAKVNVTIDGGSY